MSVSLHSVTIPVFGHALVNLAALLEKARLHVEAKKLDGSVFVNYRLFPDMLPFASQVRIACDIVKGAAARLAGVEVPKFADDETTIEQLIERVKKTHAFIDGLSPAQIDGAEGKQISLSNPRGTMTFTGLDYLNKFVLPNLYFHSATAYNILRHNGVEIGKQDFLGKIQ